MAAQAPLAAVECAWDCHVHVFGPRDHYPLSCDRRYTPGVATVEEARAHARRIGAGRLVLVQPSPYANDNRCLLDALAVLGPAARGIAALEARMLDDSTLTDLDERGIRGVRLNPNGRVHAFGQIAAELQSLSQRLAGTRWHLEVNGSPELALDVVRGLAPGVAIVFDHLMGLDPAASNFSQALATALRVVSEERVWLKISGLDRVCRSPGSRAIMDEALERFAACAGDRLLWGSDWPHTPLVAGDEGFRRVDDVAQAAAIARLPLAERVLRSNPTTLFG